MPEIHSFDCTADVWEMIIPFIIQMNEDSADEGNVGIFRRKSAFRTTQKGECAIQLYEKSFHFLPSSSILGHSLLSKQPVELGLQRPGSDFYLLN